MSMNPENRQSKADLLIGGGGMAGLTLAIAVREALGPDFSVVVADPMLDQTGTDARASAIAAAARRLFEAVGVWDAVASEAQPILDMVVTDSRLDDAMRPTFLTFDGEVAPGEPFAHMVLNDALVAALTQKARALGIDLRKDRIAGFAQSANTVTVTLAGGGSVAARLLVAADGARSMIREAAGLATHGWDYKQSGIVTIVAHERDHDGRAYEHFLPAGPFAILPLRNQRSCIVWTEERNDAERLVALSDVDFLRELEQRFGPQLGKVELAGIRRAYPLRLQIARSFTGERLALIGDAAHVIHPIAGQGINLGLRDVAALAETIADAARLGLDIGSVSVLDRYQRWRRFDTMTMGVATDILNRLFSNQSDFLRFIRDTGLGLVDRIAPLKNFFIRDAAGLVGDTPKLLKGETL